MGTEMITLKLEGGFLREMDSIVHRAGYQNRTEFIRNALREKIDAVKLREALLQITPFKGGSRKKIGESVYEEVRKKAFEELTRSSGL